MVLSVNLLACNQIFNLITFRFIKEIASETLSDSTITVVFHNCVLQFSAKTCYSPHIKIWGGYIPRRIYVTGRFACSYIHVYHLSPYYGCRLTDKMLQHRFAEIVYKTTL